MTLIRVFTSFDYDHDEDIMIMLRGQAANPRTPFDFADWSVKVPFTGDWKEKVRARIRRVDRLIVLCGRWTHLATGVGAEWEIAQAEGTTSYLMRGYPNAVCTKPSSASTWEPMFDWTWANLSMMTS
jgi:hypothetical protein